MLLLRSIYDITPELLSELGVRLLLLDVDNTLAPYHINVPERELIDWAASLKRSGAVLFIVSNNRGRRPALFAEALDIGYIGRARKPCSGALRRAMAREAVPCEETALVGDQLFTDALAARGARVTALVVRPISLRNPLLALRYAAEAPFRAIFGRRPCK